MNNFHYRNSLKMMPGVGPGPAKSTKKNNARKPEKSKNRQKTNFWSFQFLMKFWIAKKVWKMGYDGFQAPCSAASRSHGEG